MSDALPMTAEEVLESYARLVGAHQRARDEILATVRDQLDAVDAEFTPAMESARKTVNEYVLSNGTAIKAGGLHAVIMPGRVSWDTKALDGYAEAHPELKRFRKVGEPSVTIRNAK